jgi:hypothetical protein
MTVRQLPSRLVEFACPGGCGTRIEAMKTADVAHRCPSRRMRWVEFRPVIEDVQSGYGDAVEHIEESA